VDEPFDAHALADRSDAVRAWLVEEFSTPSVFVQTLAIAAACLLAFLIAPRLRAWMRTWHRQVDTETRRGRKTNAFVRRLTVALVPLTFPLTALVLLWISLGAVRYLGWPHQELKLAVSLLAAWVAIRLSSSVVRDRFWSRVIAVVAWTIAALNILGVLEEAIAFLQSLSVTIGSFRISPITVVTGLLWLALLLWLASWTARILEARVLSLSRLTPSVQLLFSRLIKVVLIIAAVFVALGTIGVDLTALAVFTGAVGVGIGFGLQAIFNNFVAGLILLSEKSLKVGDFVDLEKDRLAGTVRQINIRNTIITTPDSIDVAVPNSEFVNGRVTNWTMLDAHARIHVPFGVAYGTDGDLVRQAVLEAADQVRFTLKDDSDREPQLWLVKFGESRLEFELVVWLTTEGIHRPAGAHAAYCWAIYTALRKHGIEVPVPQRDLHLKTAVPLRIGGDSTGSSTYHARPQYADHQSAVEKTSQAAVRREEQGNPPAL
jgi:potassium-dependent mechanosensitive channel